MKAALKIVALSCVVLLGCTVPSRWHRAGPLVGQLNDAAMPDSSAPAQSEPCALSKRSLTDQPWFWAVVAALTFVVTGALLVKVARNASGDPDAVSGASW